jgi:ribonuclease Y
MDLLGIIIGLVVGGGGAFAVQQWIVGNKVKQRISEAESEAERIKKERMLQAKENFLKLKEEHENNVKERERRMQSNEDRIRGKEKSINQKLEDLNRKEKDLERSQGELTQKSESLDGRMQELDKIQQKRVAELSKISSLQPEEAKKMLMDALVDEARTAAMAQIKEISEESKNKLSPT